MNILSLKSILLHQIGAALSCKYEENAISFTEFLQSLPGEVDPVFKTTAGQSIEWRKIPLQKKQNVDAVLYTSALPQRLAAFGQTEAASAPSAIYHQLVNTLDQSRSNSKLKLIDRQRVNSPQTSLSTTKLWLDFEIETHKPGWIAFRLSPTGVVQWLGCLQAIGSPDIELVESALASPALEKTGSKLSSNIDAQTVRMLWQAQYAYACCCRLLRSRQTAAGLASADPLIAKAQACLLADWPGQATGQLSDKQPENRAAKQTLQEQGLLQALVSTADDLFWIPYRWPDQQYLLLLKRSALLCQAFEDFYRIHSRTFKGDGAIAHPQSKTQRSHQFALVCATRNVLKVLLQKHLGVRAPERL